MKVIILQNMAGSDTVYRKGREYDIEESTAISFIGSGHAKAVEVKKETKKEVVETAVEEKPKAEKTMKKPYKK